MSGPAGNGCVTCAALQPETNAATVAALPKADIVRMVTLNRAPTITELPPPIGRLSKPVWLCSLVGQETPLKSGKSSSVPSIPMAPIPVWSGNLRLSLVLVPVRLYPATSTEGVISFRMIHEPSRKPINT